MSDPLNVGDLVFWQSPGFPEWSPAEVRIVKVGRKWAYSDDCRAGTRIDRRTLELDDWGRVWRSEAEWREAKAAELAQREAWHAWEAIRAFVRNNYTAPRGLSAETIRVALAMLDVKP